MEVSKIYSKNKQRTGKLTWAGSSPTGVFAIFEAEFRVETFDWIWRDVI